MSVAGHLPIVGVGAVVFHEDRVLLVKRAKPPNENQWAIPGGKIRFGETLQHAAEREVMEETGVRIQAGKPIHAFDLIQCEDDERAGWHYVVIDLAAVYLSGYPVARDDATEARWFSQQELASYPVNSTTLELLAQHHTFRFTA